MPDAKEQLQILCRGCEKIIGEDDLLKKLERSLREKKPLRVKYGADPTAPDLHLGHTVVLRKLRQFQDLGHTVQFLIGDFTTLIGDPSGRSATRPALTPREIKANAATYQEQAFLILDRDKTEVVYNNDWCGKMNFADVIRLASRYTVARILERDDFEKRMAAKKPISLHELLYPLVQGYDSVVLKSDVELCGTDQIFNCLVGRALQHDDGQEPEAILAVPLIEGTDGVKKMSKSYGNYVAMKDLPNDWFGKLMSIPDELMQKYFANLTSLADEKIKEHLAGHPRAAKVALAREIMSPYFEAGQIVEAQAEFERVFKSGELPADIETVVIGGAQELTLSKLLVEAGLAASNSEAQRAVKAGSVKVNRHKETDPFKKFVFGQPVLISVGKRHFRWLQAQ
jgi:tyrosyl-tRNA synthetase